MLGLIWGNVTWLCVGAALILEASIDLLSWGWVGIISYKLSLR